MATTRPEPPASSGTAGSWRPPHFFLPREALDHLRQHHDLKGCLRGLRHGTGKGQRVDRPRQLERNPLSPVGFWAPRASLAPARGDLRSGYRQGPANRVRRAGLFSDGTARLVPTSPKIFRSGFPDMARA